jgi:hypothetical protein
LGTILGKFIAGFCQELTKKRKFRQFQKGNFESLKRKFLDSLKNESFDSFRVIFRGWGSSEFIRDVDDFVVQLSVS